MGPESGMRFLRHIKNHTYVLFFNSQPIFSAFASCLLSKMEQELLNWLKLVVISFTVLLLVLKVAILIWRITRKIVESPAVAPPEVHIELAAQLQHETELAAAASLSLPDDDGDSFA